MGKTNAIWHAHNRMPKNATDAQRIDWHQRHAEHCQCRPMPQSVRELIERQDKSAHAGYSGKSLVDKLGIKTGFRVRLIEVPEHIERVLSKGVQVQRSINATTDLVHVFVTERAALKEQLTRLRAKLKSDAVVWISWPKRSAKEPTDVTEDTIRSEALPLGWVDVKVCAVDATWSALKLVVRKALR